MRLNTVAVGMVAVAALVFGGLDVLGFREAEISVGTLLVWVGVVASVVSQLAWGARND